MLSLLVVKSLKISIYDDNKLKKILGTSFACSSKNGKLYQRPISELRNYFANKVNYNGVVKGESVTIKGIEGRQIDLDINYQVITLNHLPLDFGVSDSTLYTFPL